MNSTYQAMRTFADSWGLLYMMVFFLGAVIWTFRPGSKSVSEDVADIPFKEDK
ncbi:MAG: cbb3-type cytochrome c oxidase subunit 3 [Pseudomonadota bacterium]